MSVGGNEIEGLAYIRRLIGSRIEGYMSVCGNKIEGLAYIRREHIEVIEVRRREREREGEEIGPRTMQSD